MVNSPQVVMLSFWRNDANRNLHYRARHLLFKEAVTRFIWVVGDESPDQACESELRRIALGQVVEDRVQVVRHDTGITGEDTPSRFRRLGETANAGLDHIRADDDFMVIHESDLLSPVDLVPRFMATGKCPVAGWVTLHNTSTFYDTFAYRKNGVRFTNHRPYHTCYRANEVFEVDSFGSCWMCEASDIRSGVRCEGQAVIDLCRGLRARGRRLWVDPRIGIVQPDALWTPREFGRLA